MSEILVTGATGFVGGHLVESLVESGADPLCLVRKKHDGRGHCRTHVGDLLDPASLVGLCDDIERVYHLAGCASLTSKDPDSLRVNTDGTRNLLEEVCRSGSVKRFLFLSSLAAASPPPGERLSRALTEKLEGPPTFPYGQSKRDAEAMVASVCASAGIPYVILRPGLVYGPGSRPESGIPKLIRAVRSNAWVSRFDLPGRLSLIYVEDLVLACLAAGNNSDSNRTFHVSDGIPLTFGQIFTLLRRHLGLRDRLHGVSRNFAEGTARMYDFLDRLLGVSAVVPQYLLAPIGSSLACETDVLLGGFHPRYSFDRGLAETLEAV